MHKHLYNYMVTNELVTHLQSGFREGDSTTNQLLHTYHTICEAVDKGKELRAVFCDIGRALTESGTKDYFTNCIAWGAQIVLSIGLQAIYLSVDNVLLLMVNHQTGSTFWLVSHKDRLILGPLLSLIYINDIVKHIGCSIRLFADDTSLYIYVDCPLQPANLLNTD